MDRHGKFYSKMWFYLAFLLILPSIKSQQQQVPQGQVPMGQPMQQVPMQPHSGGQMPMQGQVPMQQVPMQPHSGGQMPMQGQVPMGQPMQQMPMQPHPSGQMPMQQQMHPGQVPMTGQAPVNAGPPMTMPLFDETADDAPAVAMEYKVHVDPGKEECKLKK